ncbi:DNA-(apurinic or apyrimidinic site) endonuclease-like [Battus philenor]|uniref:DNA-(apurinic or apyrimidinic site) endonuclease-like n=1 Tax=Battus philenor TaxID=42288 RepID=UPI0035D03CAF
MAPRAVKSKKAGDVKVGDNVPAKKGRKGKQNAEQESTETEVEEKTVVAEKKTKRSKKVVIEEEEINGLNEEAGPPAKKTKRKNVDEVSEEQSNGDSAPEADPAAVDELEQGDDQTEANGHTDEPKAPGGRGRKKPTKKETTINKQTGKGKKNNKADSQENEENTKLDAVDETSKPIGRGRGKKALPKPKNNTDNDGKAESLDNVAKPEPSATKGKRKQTKTNKEKTPELDNELSDTPEEEEPKKKEIKGRKNQGKKAQPKEQLEDMEVSEDPQPPKTRKGAKKDEKGKGDSNDVLSEKVPEAKPSKGKRGAQKNVPPKSTEAEEDLQDTGESTNKRRRKPIEEKEPAEDGKKKAPAKNKTLTKYEDIDFSNVSQSSQGKEWNFKIASWNVDGIRAWMDKGGLDYLKYEKPDILCLQEIKCSKEKLPEAVTNVPGYHAYWVCSEQDGYAGVGIYTTKLAMNVQYGLQDDELDSEGRIITAEYEQFYLICTYVPNAGRKLVTMPKRLKWNEEFRKHVKTLDEKKPVIICGDMNVSHNEIDLANPKTNRKNAGFTDEERQGMTDLLGDGFIDTYRYFNPEKTNAYTFWTYMFNCRAKNVGWRLDYFIVSQRLLSSLCDSVIRDLVYGSDHCPVTLFLHLTSADKPKE